MPSLRSLFKKKSDKSKITDNSSLQAGHTGFDHQLQSGHASRTQQPREPTQTTASSSQAQYQEAPSTPIQYYTTHRYSEPPTEQLSRPSPVHSEPPVPTQPSHDSVPTENTVSQLTHPKPSTNKLLFTEGWCSSCAGIPMSLFTIIDDTFYQVKPSLLALETSARDGCPFCALLLTYVAPKVTNEEAASLPIRLYQKKALERAMLGPAWRAVRYKAGAVFDVSFVISDVDDQEVGTKKFTQKDPKTGDRFISGSNNIRACFAASPDAPRGNVGAQNDEASAYAFAKHFLQKCRHEHLVCQAKQDYRPLPSRLIDVGWDEHSMKIINTEGISRREMPYLCLSYCWGKQLSANLVLTTTTNIGARNVKLELSELSKTLQDAMVVTRGLGYRYIWIDALCICQDSKQDWQAVSAKMGDIYTNADLTIAASAAADSTKGMFLARDASITQRITLEWSESPGTEVIVSPAEYIPEPEKEPLHKRAWCFQETFLSPRVLYYTKGELVFHCERIKVTESNWEFDTFIERKPEPGPVERWRYKGLSGEIEGVEELYYNNWRPIVEQYSRRGLTKEGDRLPAISAIARNWIMPRVLEEIPECVYLAGIFKGDLQKSLFWMKSDQDPLPMKRSKPYTAPSWSWASVSGGIRFCQSLNLLVLSILDTGTTPVNPEDPFGQVSDGFIKIDGYLKIARNAGTLTDTNIPLSGYLIRLPQPKFTSSDMEEAVAYLPSRMGLFDTIGSSLIGQMYFDDAEDEFEKDIYCLYIRGRTESESASYKTTSEMSISPTNHGAVFLALCKVRDGIFRRVGLGVMFDPEWFDDVERSVLTIV